MRTLENISQLDTEVEKAYFKVVEYVEVGTDYDGDIDYEMKVNIFLWYPKTEMLFETLRGEVKKNV